MSSMQRRDFVRHVGVAGLVGLGAAPFAFAAPSSRTPKSALIVVDVQNCFVTGGTLPVKGGEAVVPIINKLVGRVRERRRHAGLAHGRATSRSPRRTAARSRSRRPSSRYGTQVLWPDHCVQGSADAALHKDLALPKAQLIIRKGYHQGTDSYSAFMEADGKTSTGLAAYLKAHGVDTVYVCGLATDFCVAWTALDARKAGFKAAVIEDASRGIDLNGSLKAAWDKMTKAGVKRIQSSDIVGLMPVAVACRRAAQ